MVLEKLLSFAILPCEMLSLDNNRRTNNALAKAIEPMVKSGNRNVSFTCNMKNNAAKVVHARIP